MPTGQAAEQAAQQQSAPQPHKDDDRGPGSLAGNLTADPELRYTASGTPVSNLRVAVSERIQDANTGEWADGPTTFFDVQCWGRLAENVVNSLERGVRIVAEGRWVSNTWEDKEGTVHERVVLRARDLGPSMAFRGARLEPKQPRRA